jgi:hypothetical protein
MLKALEGPRFKLLRAKQRLDELGNELAAFSTRHPHEIVMYIDAERREQIILVRVYETISPALGVITGEFIHNVRSAIDHLACALPLIRGGVRAGKPQFPVFATDDPDDPIDERIRRRLGDIVPEAVQVIRAAQPYNRREDPSGHPLALLHALWNWDKHNEIPVVEASLAPVESDWSKVQGVLTWAEPGPIHDCQVLATCRLDDHPDAEIVGKINIEIEATLGDAAGSPGRRFLPTLSEILAFVNNNVAVPLERVIIEAEPQH